MSVKVLGIIEPIRNALRDKGYENPTPIQKLSIPILLRGKDLLACAQTGTGKTAAFAIPILQQLFIQQQHKKRPRKIKALIITPTRELAIQIGDNFTEYGKYTGIKNTVIYGGVKQGKQTDALRRGIDVLVATPGRLLDLIGQGFIVLKDVEYFVLDEADRMLDMGFINDIKKIIERLPLKRQSLFFSATMPPNIIQLSRRMLGNPEKVSVTPKQTTAEKVVQTVYFVSKSNKIKLLTHLLKTESINSTLIFSRTKHGANKIVKLLGRNGIKSEAIHGNKSQASRQRTLGNFKSGKIKILIATDIAARGIDVQELSHVINYDLPNIPETYIHRIGRTGRAGKSGEALSFCNKEERVYLRDIQKLINQKITVVVDHPFMDDNIVDIPINSGKPQKKSRPQGRSSFSGNRNSSNKRKKRYRPYSR